MNSVKSTCVVLVLAGVLYGVYITLHAPTPGATGSHSAQHAGEMQPPTIDFGPASNAPSLAAPAVELLVHNPAADGGPAHNMTTTYVTPDQSPRAELPPLVPPATPAAPELPYETPPDSQVVSPNPADSQSTEGSPASAGETSPTLEAYKLKRAVQNAEQHVQDGKFRDALAELSPFASNVQLSSEQRTQVFAWLDALAGKVIYSREHHLHEPHRVTGRKENLYEIAATYKLDPQLLININSQVVSDPLVLVPGTEIKVIPGPFRAELSLAAGELTLYVGQLYAGRFAFTIGEDRPKPGNYRVHEKRRDRVYYGRDGRQLAAGDPANPYGGCWIDLGSEAALHGSPQTNTPGSALGSLSFSPQDAQDLYAILSLQSEVVIKP